MLCLRIAMETPPRGPLRTRQCGAWDRRTGSTRAIRLGIEADRAHPAMDRRVVSAELLASPCLAQDEHRHVAGTDGLHLRRDPRHLETTRRAGDGDEARVPLDGAVEVIPGVGTRAGGNELEDRIADADLGVRREGRLLDSASVDHDPVAA